jgi:hypothetical protein
MALDDELKALEVLMKEVIVLGRRTRRVLAGNAMRGIFWWAVVGSID